MTPSDLLARSRFLPEEGNSHVIPLSGDNGGYYHEYSVPPMLFHFSVWLSSNVYDNFAVYTYVNYDEDHAVQAASIGSSYGSKSVAPLRAAEQVIIFGDKDGYDGYRAWMEEYRKRFQTFDVRRTHVPTLPSSGRYNLTFMEVEGSERKNPIGNSNLNMFEVWCWINANCEGLVFRMGNFFAFEREDEAFTFKLTHHI